MIRPLISRSKFVSKHSSQIYWNTLQLSNTHFSDEIRIAHLVGHNVLNPDVLENTSSFIFFLTLHHVFSIAFSLEISEVAFVTSLMFFILLTISPTETCSE